ASLKLIERALQFRPPGGNARHLLAEYPLNACSQEQRLLRRKRLPGRTDAGVSISCHFAPDIRTKVVPDITTSTIWCANIKFCNRRRGDQHGLLSGAPSEVIGGKTRHGPANAWRADLPDPWRADRPDTSCHGCDRSRRGGARLTFPSAPRLR